MSLDSLVRAAVEEDLKFVFVGGKGGVGKTTSSSAIATLLCNLCQKRVLLVSTDPAHSLGDAWRQSFSNRPTRISSLDGGASNNGFLEVMEIDPLESMAGELQAWMEVSRELLSSGDNDKSDGAGDEWSTKIQQFQEWLSGIPGIDEATALSMAITHIESGRYDVIVFDTAPTGHTVKLLALPAILEEGINKLQSWQTTFWGYWEAFKAAASSGSVDKAKRRAQLKDQVEEKLTKYKHDIQKVAMMLQDPVRTRFVVVCIAEFLSVSETQRLLQELKKHQVVASHIVVNQLIVQDALQDEELAELESLAEVGNLQIPQGLLQKTVHACRLTTARRTIQTKYLEELKAYPETNSILDGICEVPLLAEEVTGPDAIVRFSKLLVQSQQEVQSAARSSDQGGTGKLYDALIAEKNSKSETADDLKLVPGDAVRIIELAKAPHFNDIEGIVSTSQSKETGRYGVQIEYQGKSKTLALQPKNIVLVRKGQKKSKRAPGEEEKAAAGPSNAILDKAKRVLEDPEIKKLVDQNPQYKAAVEDCLASPMNVMKYLGDPGMSQLISKVMAKM